MDPRLKCIKHILIVIVLSVFTQNIALSQDRPFIRFGVLPALQALPLFVADSKGLFLKSGLHVDLILFNTAAEKDIALASGSLEGCFADMVTPLVLKGNGRDIIIAAKNYDTRFDRRMFAILAGPSSKLLSLKDLNGKSVAISSNSVVDLVSEELQTQAGIPKDKINSIESKNIGLRFQALLNGQLDAAVLPEPLVTVALSKGARLLADDSGLGQSQTVLVFSREFVNKHPVSARSFLKVIQEANDLINTNPDSVRDIMVDKVRLPKSLKMQYPVPKFPRLAGPDRDILENIVIWLKQRGVVRKDIEYEQVVSSGLIP